MAERGIHETFELLGFLRKRQTNIGCKKFLIRGAKTENLPLVAIPFVIGDLIIGYASLINQNLMCRKDVLKDKM